jgi:hypothetical protein
MILARGPCLFNIRHWLCCLLIGSELFCTHNIVCASRHNLAIWWCWMYKECVSLSRLFPTMHSTCLVLSVPSMSLGWLLLFNIKHGGLNFTLLPVFPHSQQLLACAIIVCLIAPCCLAVFAKNWHAADSLSTWNQYKWMTMHHTSLNLLFLLSTPCF